jgi:hypothetical protein
MKVVIPNDLKRRFKMACVDQDTTMSEVVCALVQGWLDGHFSLEDTEIKSAASESQQKPD